MQNFVDFIARMHGCMQNDSEMHETVLLDCMTGEAGSAIQQHQSSAFHCQFAHTCEFSLLSHTFCVQMEFRWLLSNEFNTKNLLVVIFLRIRHLSHCIAESWWNIPFKGTQHGNGVEDGAILSCYDCDIMHQHYDVTLFEYVLWRRAMHEWVMNIHYQNMIRTPSKQWGMCDNT